MTARPRLALLATPLIAAAAFWSMVIVAEPSAGRVHLVGGGPTSGLLMLVLISVPITFATLFTFAVPAAYLLKHFNRWTRWAAVLLGAVAGLVAAIAAFSVPTLVEVNTLAIFAVIAGAVGGITFVTFGMAQADRSL